MARWGGRCSGESVMGISRFTMAMMAAFAAVAAAAAPASAAVERVEVLERVPFAPGMNLGDTGAYEKIRGIAHFALDPIAAANQSITDLKLAPRDADGRVTFASEFVFLRPVSG